MSKLDFRNLEPVGKCSVCGINLWAETNNEPAIFPCGVPSCPYPHRESTEFERSSTGSSLSQIFYGA